MNLLNLDKKYTLLDYYCVVALLFSVIFAISIFYDILQIHVYRHDSIYYYTQKWYLNKKVAAEGRWLVYLFHPIVTKIPGSIWSIFILLSFSYFIFISAYRWTHHLYYSAIVSLLFLQIPSFYDLIQWPAASVPTFFVLLFSIYLVKRLPVFIFYTLFGILFFGAMSNYYYLLPLLHLDFLSGNKTNENNILKFIKILAGWAVGFIIGYIFAQLITHLYFGHFMQIASWRSPNYIDSVEDVTANSLHSFDRLRWHIKDIFSQELLVLSYAAGFIISIYRRKKESLLVVLLFFFMICIHYIVTIPVGIYIANRTVVATWVAVMAIIFFIPSIQQWKVFLLIPIIVLFTYSLYERNHNNLQWYSVVTGTHYENLISQSPLSPESYKGIVVFASDSDIKKKNKLISKTFNLRHDAYMEHLDDWRRWKTSAIEAGFQSITFCKDEDIKTNNICKNIIFSSIGDHFDHINNYFYDIIGEYGGRLVIAFSRDNIDNAIKTMNIEFDNAVKEIVNNKSVVKADFDIYLNKDKLFYYKSPCSKKDIEHRFFLHIIPKDNSVLAKGRNFKNMDFEFDGLIKDDTCIVSKELPKFDIKAISTGQFSTVYDKNKKRSFVTHWKSYIDVE